MASMVLRVCGDEATRLGRLMYFLGAASRTSVDHGRRGISPVRDALERQRVVADAVVGRGIELIAVDRFVERATGELAALVLDGEAGIGKTTIWRAALGVARDASMTVLTCRPARSEQALTLGALTDLLADVDDHVLERLPDPRRHALDVALLRIAPSGPLPDQRTLSVPWPACCAC
jgi:hypothetical protein